MRLDFDLNEYKFTGDELAKAQEFAHEFAGGDDDDIGTAIMLGLMKFFGAISEPGVSVLHHDKPLERSRAAHARLTALARLANDPRMMPYQLDQGDGLKSVDPRVFDAAAQCPLSSSRKADEWNSFASSDEFFSILLGLGDTEGRA